MMHFHQLECVMSYFSVLMFVSFFIKLFKVYYPQKKVLFISKFGN